MTEGMKVLLVEDEEMIRDLYARQLTKAGFIVNAVGTGEEALKVLGEQTYDLLLQDIMLPGINGLEVIRDFKIKNPGSKMSIIMLTNLGQETVIKEGFDLGANAYLIKTSYTPDQIIQEIRNVLEGKPSNPNPAPIAS